MIAPLLLIAANSFAAQAAGPRAIHAKIPATADRWPVAVKVGGNAASLRTSVALRQVKIKGRLKGTASAARAVARLHDSTQSRWLVVSVWPTALESKRMHFEIRLRLVESFVEEAKVGLVTVTDARPNAGDGLDSDEMRRAGVEFEEETPASGRIVVAALDPRVSKKALNAGALRMAAFARLECGLTDVTFVAKGLQ